MGTSYFAFSLLDLIYPEQLAVYIFKYVPLVTSDIKLFMVFFMLPKAIMSIFWTLDFNGLLQLFFFVLGTVIVYAPDTFELLLVNLYD